VDSDRAVSSPSDPNPENLRLSRLVQCEERVGRSCARGWAFEDRRSDESIGSSRRAVCGFDGRADEPRVVGRSHRGIHPRDGDHGVGQRVHGSAAVGQRGGILGRPVPLLQGGAAVYLPRRRGRRTVRAASAMVARVRPRAQSGLGRQLVSPVHRPVRGHRPHPGRGLGEGRGHHEEWDHHLRQRILQ